MEVEEMKRTLLQNQKVQMIDDSENFYEINVLLSAENENEGTASIPEIGRLEVIKENDVWTIKERFIFTVEEDEQTYIARLDMPHVKKTCHIEEKNARIMCMIQFNFFKESKYVYHYQDYYIVTDKNGIDTWFYKDEKNITFKLEEIAE